MNVDTALERAEASFRAQTGKSPTDLQKKIFRKALEDKTYEQIANECNCNLSYAKGLGSEFWRLLSSALGKEVRKKSFKNVLEEDDRSPPTLQLPEKLPESAIARSRQDWGEAPDVSVFYGRRRIDRTEAVDCNRPLPAGGTVGHGGNWQNVSVCQTGTKNSK